MKTYPYKRFPPQVDKYLNGEIVDLSELDPPLKPTLKKSDYGGYLIALVLVITILVLAYFEVKHSLVYLILVSIILLTVFVSITENKTVRLNNGELKSRYRLEVEHVNAENQRRKKRLRELQQSNQIADYIKQKIRGELLDYTKPELISWQTKKGLSESFFVRFLFNCFKENIKPYTKLYSNIGNLNDYQPDFVFQNEKICIDIEVDEPYVIEGRKPIHLSNETGDSYRDNFFVENKWCVIRFSEEQALINPYECCKYIAQVIFDLTGDGEYLGNLSFRGSLKPTNTWTKNEAETMAFKRTRELLFLKANHQASQPEYFSKNYFEEKSILVTKVSEWNDKYHLCLNNNFYGPQTLALSKTLFPLLAYGQTIELELDSFSLENDCIIHIIPPKEDEFFGYKEHKEAITKIAAFKK